MTNVIDLPLPGLPGLLRMKIWHGEDSEPAGLGVEGMLIVHEDHLAATGYLHAGTVVSLADTACGYGCLATLPPGKAGFTTIELKANFLSTAAPGQRITVRADAVHRGRTTQVWDATVFRSRGDEETDRSIALFRCTQALLD